MRYNWNLYEIRNNLTTLQSYLQKNKNLSEEEKKNVEETIILYEIMLEDINKKNYKNISTDENYLEYSLEDYLETFTYNLANSHMPLINIIANSYNYIKDFKARIDYNFIINFKNDYLIDLNQQFLTDILPPCYLKKYQKLLNKNPDYLQIQKNYNSSSTSGQLFLDTVLDKKYILFNRSNTTIDLHVLPHESFHFIFRDDYFIDNKKNMMPFSCEIEGSLANILFIKWLYEHYPMQAAQLDEDFLLYYQGRAISLILYKIYLNSLNKNKNFQENKFKLNCEKYGFTEKLELVDLKEFFDIEIAVDCITYNISNLIALDLFEVLKTDKEKAFYLLERICSIKESNDLLNTLRKHEITFMDDNYNNFRSYIKLVQELDIENIQEKQKKL